MFTVSDFPVQAIENKVNNLDIFNIYFVHDYFTRISSQGKSCGNETVLNESLVAINLHGSTKLCWN